ncbi:MAG: CHAT domain-containing protein [Gemmatimonadetes bacterium]|nr:CHAT domain-containing protein [Gemmatimonadota bacterium]
MFTLLLGVCLLAGVLLAARRPAPGLVGQLTRATRDHGVAGLRVSIISGFRACAGTEANAGELVCGAGEGVPSRRTVALIRRAADAARAGADPQALHAAALALMLFPAPGGNHLDQSISHLQTAARLTDDPAPALADVAAAHLMRARLAGSPRDLYQALEAAERALELEPADRTARFNAAAALEQMRLGGQAARAWTLYLAVDSTSGWAREARRRRAGIAVPRPVRAPGRTAARAELEAFAAAAPSEARELGWDDLLREWGGAVLRGDTVTAWARLEQAEAIGSALVARGGDASLADAVATIRRDRGNRAELRRLARVHVELADGRKAMLDGDYDAACPRFRRVLRGDAAAPVREWAQVFQGFCSSYAPDGTPVDLARAASQSDTLRYPAAAGRKWLALALARSIAGRYAEAREAYGRAAALFAGAGEREYAATARTGEGNAWILLGESDAGHAALHEALGVLRDYPGSLGLWNALYALRDALLADGMPHAAMRVQDEGVAATRRMRPALQAETRLARARLHLAAGRRDIGGDTAFAAETMNSVEQRYGREWLRADLRSTRAEAWLESNPRLAEAELDSVVEYFRGHAPRLLPALFSRAQARLALGHQEQAGADLRRAAAVLDSQRARVNSAQLRASLLERSRRVFDQAVMLSVRGGRAEEALDYVERSRSSFSPVGHAADWAARPLRAPRGQVAVEFALVADTLLAWTLWEGGLHLTRRTVRRDELVRNVERVRSALELRSADAVVLPALEALYDELIRPLRPRLGPAGTPLLIVADGELAGLPVAALRDAERGRFVVEDHPVRFASSLRDPTAAVRPAHGVPVTLVADPAFDRRAFPELQRLAGAAAEVDAIAGLYADARVLAGAQADAAAIRASLLRGGVAHFAGHAVFDDARPERSFLVTAPGRENASPRITAAEIERMDLRGLRLVVLSACQTSRAQAGRSGGFAGLAGAFMAAGAGGVVGSLWRVDDHSTRALMERFHAGYRRSGDAAQALRQAQLQMLRSDDASLRSPAAWAGFRYAGG